MSKTEKIEYTDFDELLKIIKKNKGGSEGISPASIATYFSILKNLHRNMFGLTHPFNKNCFEDQEKILEFLNNSNYKPSKRKTILSALIAYNGIEKSAEYKELMMKDSKAVEDEKFDNKKNEKQSKNWMSLDEIRDVFDYKYSLLKPILKSKKEISEKQFTFWTEFIILCLTTGLFIKPRRSQDWTLMKKKNFDEMLDNCIVMNVKQPYFVFNQYKTKAFHHTQKIPIPPKLATLLKPFVEVDTGSDFLLVNKKNQPLTVSRITQILNAEFDRKISTSMLRHIFLTESIGESIPKDFAKKLIDTAKEMGHTPEEALSYIKYD